MISLVDVSSGCTWDVALMKGDCPSCLMAVGLGATVCPVCSELYCKLSLSPVESNLTGGVFPELMFGFWSIGEALLEYILCYSIRDGIYMYG